MYWLKASMLSKLLYRHLLHVYSIQPEAVNNFMAIMSLIRLKGKITSKYYN